MNQPYRIRCAEIWGGIQEVDLEVETASVRASIYSKSSNGTRGGDIHYFSVCGSDMLTRIALADVQGHGEEVSAISDWLYRLVRDSMDSVHATEVLAELNRRALDKGFEAASTAAILSYYLGDRRLHVSYAGHPPVLLQRHGQPAWQQIRLDSAPGLNNLPLGLFSDVAYTEKTLELGPGDRLLVHTDGITDFPSAAGTPVGPDWLLSQLASLPAGTVSQLKASVLAKLAAENATGHGDDDMTLMAIETI